MGEVWDQARIQQYKDNQIQESLNLDYKGADALDKRNPKRSDDISKDVSAMANSAGGLIIYGIAEKNQLPDEITPINATTITRESLEQIINSTIQPRISGIVIYPVPLDTAPNDTVYVVDIPQSTTAHQANDKKYYRRFNFESVAMDDYEIRDVMARSQHPKINISFEMEIRTVHSDIPFQISSTSSTQCYLVIAARNIGSVYAQFVNCFIKLPSILMPLEEIKFREEEFFEDEDGQKYFDHYEDNTVRDIVEAYPVRKYGSSRYDPILPGLSQTWETEINGLWETIDLTKIQIRWEAFADNAPPSSGQINLADIPITDKRKSTNK